MIRSHGYRSPPTDTHRNGRVKTESWIPPGILVAPKCHKQRRSMEKSPEVESTMKRPLMSHLASLLAAWPGLLSSW